MEKNQFSITWIFHILVVVNSSWIKCFHSCPSNLDNSMAFQAILEASWGSSIIVVAHCQRKRFQKSNVHILSSNRILITCFSNYKATLVPENSRWDDTYLEKVSRSLSPVPVDISMVFHQKIVLLFNKLVYHLNQSIYLRVWQCRLQGDLGKFKFWFWVEWKPWLQLWGQWRQMNVPLIVFKQFDNQIMSTLRMVCCPNVINLYLGMSRLQRLLDSCYTYELFRWQNRNNIHITAVSAGAWLCYVFGAWSVCFFMQYYWVDRSMVGTVVTSQQVIQR